MRPKFCTKFFMTVKEQMHSLPVSFVEICLKLTNPYGFNHDKPSFTAHMACVTQDTGLAASELSGFIEKNKWPSNSQTVRSSTCYGNIKCVAKCWLPCWTRAINSNRSLRRWISWKSPADHLKSCHKNTSTRWWRTSPSAWLSAWLPVVVTSWRSQ